MSAPRLRAGERQGDILSTQAAPEPFALIGGNCRDFAAEAKRDAEAEAQRIEWERQQLSLFSEEAGQ